MEEINKNQIIPIPMGVSNAYVVANGNQAILIDTGSKGKKRKIADALQRMSVSPHNIRLIILTHTHYDHSGNAKALKALTGAKVIVHKEEAGCLEQGFTELPKGTTWFYQLFSSIGSILAKKICKYAPVSPDIIISERFDLKEYGIDGYILPTPGHTPGSISVIIEEKHAIVGDTLFNISKNSVFPPYANDQRELLRSWGDLLATECEYYYPGHGKPFARDKFNKTYKKKIARLRPLSEERLD